MLIRLDWNGRLSAVTNGSGFVVKYMHDIMDRVTNISWRTTSGAAIGGFQYEYDAVGRIVSRRQEIGDPSHPSQMSRLSQKNYDYDDLDRLASDGDVSYTYDAAGNRMTRTEDGETITYTLGVGDRLASWNGGAYTHDIAGNVTRIERTGRPTLDLTWNSQYQLVSVATNGVFAEGYEYDALCRRVSTTTLEGTTRHVYDEKWQVIADLDEDGDVVASYTWGDGIDNLLSVSIGDATYYPLADIQGTVWGYVDSQNNVVARWQYDAWGNVVDESVSVPALASLRYRFQCREWSVATGLINFRMRWYDPETGRWLSKDPIGLSGGLNLYAFCGNTPLNSVDFYGESGLVLFARPTVAPRFLLENSPKPILPKPQHLPRISSLLKDWGPGKPIPKGFRPPPKPEGNWYNPFTKESLHNDMNHPKPFEPHWDYIDTEGNHFRWFPDGRIIPKPLRSFQLPQPNDDEREGVGSAEEKSVRFA